MVKIVYVKYAKYQTLFPVALTNLLMHYKFEEPPKIEIWFTFVELGIQTFSCHPGGNSEETNKIIRKSGFD